MITTEKVGQAALITIDRHAKRNALDTALCGQLETAVTAAAADGARVLVITGQGTAFCAGADLRGVYTDEFRAALYAMLHAITDLPVPVIAAVNGPAIGAGTQLAIACDLRVAAPSAVFAVPTARNGLAVDPWTIRRLALLAGGGAARAMLLGCQQIDAHTAYARGLADRLGDLADALAWAGEICSYSQASLRYSKQALNTLGEPLPWPAELDRAFDACWAAAAADGDVAREGGSQ